MIRYALLLILPAIIMADRFEDTAVEMFGYVDFDKNGKATVDEMHKHFQAYDVDKDGRVSRSEYTSYYDLTNSDLHYVAHRLFDVYDVSKDHILDISDFDSLHKLIDSNSNGEVSQDEWTRFWVIILQDIDYLLPSN